MFKKIALTTVATIAFSAAAQAESTLIFTGGSFTEDSYYTYLGGTHAINGDIKKDGFLIRFSGAYGEYEYGRPSTTDVNGDVAAADAMLGYQVFSGAHRFTLYVGGDYQDHDLSPLDTLNPVRGNEFGLKGQAEAILTLAESTKLDLAGSYSGAFDSYWSKAQLGQSLNSLMDCSCDVKVGPELTFLGSESYDQQRYGAFVKDIALGQASLGASAGYAHTEGRGEDGAYGEVTLSITF